MEPKISHGDGNGVSHGVSLEVILVSDMGLVMKSVNGGTHES